MRTPAGQNIIEYFSRTLWEIDPDTYRGFKRYRIRYLQIMTLVVRNFWDDKCLLRASALSFTSILSIVPFFALTFAVLKGLGVQNRLEPFLLEQVTAGSHEVVNRIITYINNTNMTSMGAIGLVTLLVTVIALLDNIEDAFNAIWGVKETRSLYRKFSDYLSVLISGPLLLMAAISITTTLESQAVVKWLIDRTYLGDLLLSFFHLVPYVSVWIALFFLYTFIPNTRVRYKSALIGGILAGTSWQIAQWAYIHFQVGVAKYNAIYGTLALLPIFMVWIYTSWLIVLFGVEVVSAHQNIRTFRREIHNPVISENLREILALSILQEIAIAFHNGLPVLNGEQLAEALDAPFRVVRNLLDELAEAGFLVAIAGEEDSFQPARELDRILINDVLLELRNHGTDKRIHLEKVADSRLYLILKDLEETVATKLDGITLRELSEPTSRFANNKKITAGS